MTVVQENETTMEQVVLAMEKYTIKVTTMLSFIYYSFTYFLVYTMGVFAAGVYIEHKYKRITRFFVTWRRVAQHAEILEFQRTQAENDFG